MREIFVKQYKVLVISLTALMLVFVANVSTSYALEKNSGIVVGLGRGIMNISGVPVVSKLYVADPPTTDFDLWILEFGGFFNEGKTQIFLDILFAESKDLYSGGRRALVGGGYTNVTYVLNHVGVFIGLRQKIIYRLYGNISIGGLSQEKSAVYDVNVYGGSGSAGSIESGGWSYGLDFSIIDQVLVGLRKFESFEKYDVDFTTSSTDSFTFEATSLQVTFLF